MARIEFYDGSSALAHDAQVSAFNGQVIIRANGQSLTVAATDITPTLSTPNGRRFINLPNNMALEFHDNADAEKLLDGLNAPHLRHMRWFDRNYRTWPFIGGAVAMFVGLVAALYFVFLPIAADSIAYQMPAHMLDKTSIEALAQLEDDKTLLPSKLSKSRQAVLLAKFNALKKPDTSVPFKLHFYSAPQIGPNAFALPSGDVALLDELVNLTTSDDQIMGVLSHELGHVAHKHTLRGIIQNSLVSFAIAAWLGDYGSTLVNFGASTLFSQKYSRDLEREADDYAIKMMTSNHMSPAALADFFVVMESKYKTKAKTTTTTTETTASATTGTKKKTTPPPFNIGDLFKDHPPTAERIQTLRNAAAKYAATNATSPIQKP